jgi:hypothetical protein
MDATIAPGRSDLYLTPDTVLHRVQMNNDLDELEMYLDACYTLGQGFRARTVVANGYLQWRIDVTLDTPPRRNDQEVRAWETPEGVPVERSATSANRTRVDVVDFAVKAAAAGRWVQIHTVRDGVPVGDWDCSGPYVYVVDVLAASPPAVGNDVFAPLT